MKRELILWCLTGILPITLSTTPHVYYLVMKPMTWSDAQNYCAGTYVDLAAVESSGDWRRLAAEATAKLMTAPAWIGLYNNVDSWRWSYNNLALATTTFTNWHSGAPTDGTNACGAIDYLGYWYDLSCSNMKSYICYDSRLSGTARFISYTLPLFDWATAQAYCRKVHTDLATSSSSAENTVLKQKVLFMTSAWFGLHRDTWTWTDEIVASNIPWAFSQPNNQNGAENCVTYTAPTTSDETCTSQYAFFCHSIPPVKQRQIVRLQVKSDGSVFDPVVHSPILEQVKQILQNNGMEMANVTVTWRVQPNQNIFIKKRI